MSDVVERAKGLLENGICGDDVVRDLIAEVERLREAVTAADAILSLLHHRGLVNSENNRRDVAEVSEQLATLRRSGR